MRGRWVSGVRQNSDNVLLARASQIVMMIMVVVVVYEFVLRDAESLERRVPTSNYYLVWIVVVQRAVAGTGSWKLFLSCTLLKGQRLVRSRCILKIKRLQFGDAVFLALFRRIQQLEVDLGVVSARWRRRLQRLDLLQVGFDRHQSAFQVWQFFFKLIVSCPLFTLIVEIGRESLTRRSRLHALQGEHGHSSSWCGVLGTGRWLAEILVNEHGQGIFHAGAIGEEIFLLCHGFWLSPGNVAGQLDAWVIIFEREGSILGHFGLLGLVDAGGDGVSALQLGMDGLGLGVEHDWVLPIGSGFHISN
jgi:hypothetical protein